MQAGSHLRGSGMPGDAGLNTAANRTSATHLQSFQERPAVYWSGMTCARHPHRTSRIIKTKNDELCSRPQRDGVRVSRQERDGSLSIDHIRKYLYKVTYWMQINFTLFDMHYSVVYRPVPIVSDWVHQVATLCSFFDARCRDPANLPSPTCSDNQGFRHPPSNASASRWSGPIS
jgi:hypothetical protein